MRICLVYDCLYPWTVGGAERWYRQLATELATAGHDVTYLTRRQWRDGEAPSIDGVTVVAVSPGGSLYDPAGRRLPVPPLRFGAGVGGHLARHRSSYDVVHLCSFPYLALPAARLALAGTATRVQVDWFELWSSRYWLGYAGPVLGRVGALVQRLCVRLTPKAFAFSDLTARRLRAGGFTGELVRLTGLYGGPIEGSPSIERPDPPLVVYAGRHTFEKQVDALPPALAVARRHLPGLRAIILGDGPLRASVMSSITELGLGEAVEAPGFVPSEDVAAAMKAATCLVVPSMREGYGLVVVEAASWATPVVVVAGEDNAAVELVEEGVNGFVVPDRSPESIARGILAVHEGGPELRSRCASWFRRRAAELASSASVRRIVDEVGAAAPDS
ncbi:MAG TPA: glycosyltransferase family 4 protein [Acidimicrobiales bacterium]|nr:glycosyltransferase family 4 protein [Acidimicrobiales bacterium]